MNLVGFHEAGKTSLARRLMGQDFDPSGKSTEGIVLHYIKSAFNKMDKTGGRWTRTTDDQNKVFLEETKQSPDLSHTVSASCEDNTDKKVTKQLDPTNLATASPQSNENETLTYDVKTIPDPLEDTSEREVGIMKRKTTKDTEQIVSEQRKQQVKEKIPFISPILVNSNSSDSSSEGESEENTPFELGLWDLGGQNDFITTHHLFLDIEATTVIVMDITKEFDQQFKKRDKDLKLKRSNPRKPSDIMHYWLNILYLETEKKKEIRNRMGHRGFRGNPDKDTEDGNTPGQPNKEKQKDENTDEERSEHEEKITIKKESHKNNERSNLFIVLTHIDKIEQDRNDDIKKYKKQILESVKGKPYANLVQEDNIFPVDNLSHSEDIFQPLRNLFIESFSRQESWGIQIPTRWLQLQTDIKMAATGEKYKLLQDLKTFARNEYQMNGLEVESFIKLHHKIGTLFHFDNPTPLSFGNGNDMRMKDIVITDPQWLLDKCKEVITHPEFIENRKPEGTLRQETLDLLKKGIVTYEGLSELWGEDEVDFLTKLMLAFDLFLPMVISGETNDPENSQPKYLIPCMLPVDEPSELVLKLEDGLCLYDADQETEYGDWFQVGAFDKLLTAFIRTTPWELSTEPPPSYAMAYFVSGEHLRLRLSLEENPRFRVVMYCDRDVMGDLSEFIHTIGTLRKTKKLLYERTKRINIKRPTDYKVLCPNYDPSDVNSNMIEAEEQGDGVIQISENLCLYHDKTLPRYERCCPCHNKPLPSDQYTWLMQNLCKFNVICLLSKLQSSLTRGIYL